jgi:septum formation protein
LLKEAGIGFDADAPHIDETRRSGEAPADYVERMAREKASAVAARHPGRLVLGADTIVVIDDDVLGKPVDAADAARMLRRLSGHTHEVLTAVAVVSAPATLAALERTLVTMRPIDDEEIAAYVASGEPLDKAGAYAIQGGAGPFVDRIEGALDTVVGLPVERTLELLRLAGFGGV